MNQRNLSTTHTGYSGGKKVEYLVNRKCLRYKTIEERVMSSQVLLALQISTSTSASLASVVFVSLLSSEYHRQL